jgi:hypothetical protein
MFMAGGNMTDMLNTLMPVIVGGLIGIGGTLVGPPFLHWIQTKAEKKKKRADKFEELVEAIYAFDHWMDLLKSIRVFGEDDKEPISPLAKIQAISSVYFPQFDTAISEMNTTALAYQVWMFEAGQRRIAGKIAEVKKGHIELYRPYSEKRSALLDELKEFAKREFQ